MKLQYLRAFIVLLAGLIALIINMKTGREVTRSLLIVLIVIVVFYFIATLVVEILQQGMEKAAEKDRELEEQRRLEERKEELEKQKQSESGDLEDSNGVIEEDF